MRIRFVKKPLCLVFVAVGAFAAGASGVSVAQVAPGDVVMLRCGWDRQSVPLSVYVRPRLFARDAAGKVVWSGNVGAYFQHAVSATPPHRRNLPDLHILSLSYSFP